MKDKDGIKCYFLNNIEITNGDEIDFNEDTQIYWELLYYIKEIYKSINESYPKYILFNTHNPNKLQIIIYRNNINYHNLFKYIKNIEYIYNELNTDIELNKFKEYFTNIEYIIL